MVFCGKQSESGLTLLEVMFILIVLGILGLIAAPRIEPVLARQRLASDAQKICWTLRDNRERSIASGSPQSVEFFLYGSSYRLLPNGTLCQLSGGISYDFISIPKNEHNRILLSYNILGTPSQGGTIALKNNFGDKKYIVITPVIGRVRVSDTPP